MVHVRKELEAELKMLLLKQSDQNLELLPDYHQRIEVLKTLRFIDPMSESVLLKGRVACEINSANELILTELILDNTLTNFTPEETVALLSIFIFQEKTELIPELTPKLAEVSVQITLIIALRLCGTSTEEGSPLQGYGIIVDIADRVNAVLSSNQINFEDFGAPQKLGLVEVVHEWAKGMVGFCSNQPDQPRL